MIDRQDLKNGDIVVFKFHHIRAFIWNESSGRPITLIADDLFTIINVDCGFLISHDSNTYSGYDKEGVTILFKDQIYEIAWAVLCTADIEILGIK